MASRLMSWADIVVSPTVQAILNKLGDPLLRRDFGSTWGVGKELDILSRTMERIEAILEVVEIKQRKDRLLKPCLFDLRSEAYDVDDVLDEFLIETRQSKNKNQNQVPYSLSFALNENRMLHRNEIGPFITKINEKLATIKEELKEHYPFQGPAEEMHHAMITRLQSFPPRETRRMVSSMVDERHVFGREEDVKNVRNMLLSDKYNGRDAVSVVSIVAMGGMGKTTLAQLLYNDPHIKEYFKEKAWVCVSDSDQFYVERITREILKFGPSQSINALQLALHDKLKGKRFLIVLDDVWNERRADWDKLRVPFKDADRGSRILVTTRSKKVSTVMSATETYYMKGLSNAVGWSLFKDRAFIDPNTNTYPNLEDIGKQIVSKCKGLPLAINTLGGLLYDKVDENDWRFVLESEIWDIEEDEVLPALSLSYYHLPSHLKQCFAYCSLFPKDYEFRKETLVQLWIAEGFVQTKQVNRKEVVGLQYFDDLLHRSFFQSQFSSNLRHLVYLRIRSHTMKTLPESICMLYNLQELDIEGCWALVELPENISNLSNLQHLKMEEKWWEATRRPRRVGKLKCLNRIPYFDVGKEAGENIGELKEMMSLEGYLFIKNLQNAREEQGDGNLKNMEKIDKLKLRWDESSSSCNRSVFSALQPPIGLKSLEIAVFPDLSYPTWMTTDISAYNQLVSVTLSGLQSETLPYLGQLPSLTELQIICGRTRLLNHEFYRGTGGRKGFQKLTSLTLSWMECLEESCDAEDGEFPSLQRLTIMYCPRLRRLPRLFPTTGEPQQLGLSLTSLHCEYSGCFDFGLWTNGFHRFTSLLDVYISDYKQEVLFPNEFLPPMLEVLTLRDCYNIKSLPKNLHTLSSLRSLLISQCENLASLPEEGMPKSLQYLKIENCHDELTKRCQLGGEDWPKISHIPKLEVIPSSGSMSDNEDSSSSE